MRLFRHLTLGIFRLLVRNHHICIINQRAGCRQLLHRFYVADVDECRTNNGGCDWKCVNTHGSRRCVCPDGYRLTDDKCIDVNECLLRNGHGPCQDTCINTVTHYHNVLLPGVGSLHLIALQMGGYYCTCDGLKGTVLARDNHSCEEVNDCNTGAAGCSHSCISTFGRSFCTCPDGYELGDDWRTCHGTDQTASALALRTHPIR